MNSRFTFLLVLTYIFISFGSLAQVFTGNLHGGLSSSQISGDGSYGFVQFGVYAGVGTIAEFKGPWSVSGSLMFNQKGARIYKSANNFSTYQLRVNYAEAPVLLGYSYNKWLVQAGAYTGFKINQREKTEFGVEENPREFNPLDIGVQLQVSYEIKEQWNLTLAFQNSLIPTRSHASQLAYPPSNFVLGDYHQKLLDKGQYFTTLMLFVTRSFGS